MAEGHAKVLETARTKVIFGFVFCCYGVFGLGFVFFLLKLPWSKHIRETKSVKIGKPFY